MLSDSTTQSRRHDVAVIVLNWRRSDLVRRCVARLQAQATDARMRLVVVDNESGETERVALSETLTALAKGRTSAVASVALLACDANLGFAAGMNRGIAFARKRFDPDFFWLLNNDTEPEESALQALLDTAASRQDWGVIGSVIHGEPLADGSPLYGGYRYQPWLSRLKPCLTPEIRPDYVAGAAMFVRAEVFTQAGLLSEEFFLYGEEMEFARRIERAGWGQGCAQQSIVWHHSGQSVGARSPLPARSARWAREYFENRSAFLLTWRFDRAKLPVVVAVRLAAKAVSALARRSRFGAVISALSDFRRPLPVPVRAGSNAARVQLILDESNCDG